MLSKHCFTALAWCSRALCKCNGHECTRAYKCDSHEYLLALNPRLHRGDSNPCGQSIGFNKRNAIKALFFCARLMLKGPVQVQWSWMYTRVQVWFTRVTAGTESKTFMTRTKTNLKCCYRARSVPFDDPRYLCLPGWKRFSHFNRELTHDFPHHWNDSVLVFYDLVYATETLSITCG